MADSPEEPLYDYNPPTHVKPGQTHAQGLLFRTNARQFMTDAQRWPRGYTPERQREVEAVLPPMVDERPVSRQRRWNSRKDRMQSRGQEIPRLENYREEDSELSTRTKATMSLGLARLKDYFKRSTVPPEQMVGLSKVSVFDSYYGPEGTHALYQKAPKAIVSFTDRDKPLGGEALGHVLMHELGHHVSQFHNPDDYDPSTPEGRGKEEAVAENFADTHAVEDPRTPQKDIPLSGYEESAYDSPLPGSFRDIADQDPRFGPGFTEGYRQHRTPVTWEEVDRNLPRRGAWLPLHLFGTLGESQQTEQGSEHGHDDSWDEKWWDEDAEASEQAHQPEPEQLSLFDVAGPESRSPYRTLKDHFNISDQTAPFRTTLTSKDGSMQPLGHSGPGFDPIDPTTGDHKTTDRHGRQIELNTGLGLTERDRQESREEDDRLIKLQMDQGTYYRKTLG